MSPSDDVEVDPRIEAAWEWAKQNSLLMITKRQIAGVVAAADAVSPQLEYELGDDDRAIVQATTRHATDTEKPDLRAIHEAQLRINKTRLARIERERDALRRAIAMREASLRALA